MKIHFVDTNIFIYLLFQVDKRKQERCKKLFQKAELGKVNLWTTEWVIAELVWFLTRQKTSPDQIKTIILQILATKGLAVTDKVLLLEVLDLWYEGNDFIDVVNIIKAKKADILQGFSFDKGLDRFSSFHRLEP